MKKYLKIIISLCIIGVFLISFIVFNNKSDYEMTKQTTNSNNKETNYGIAEFSQHLRNKNYKFVLKKGEEDFLPTERNFIEINGDFVQIYSYKDNDSMEKDAAGIDKDGYGYKCQDDGTNRKNICIDWISKPYFYKKGKIIVLYVGENKKIISDLKSILGETFAGGAVN